MKILFVCEGNVNRSQMAGAMLKSFAPAIDVLTAGVRPGGSLGKTVAQVSPEGVAAMHVLGLDISSSTVTELTSAMVDIADKIILMGPLPGATAPNYLKDSPKLETWDVPDPGYNQISYTGARDIILERVKELVPRITKVS